MKKYNYYIDYVYIVFIIMISLILTIFYKKVFDLRLISSLR